MECNESLGHLADWQPGNHLCFLYETEEEHRAVLVPFLRQGLEQGEKVIYLWDHRVPETILTYLEKEGMDLEPYLGRGQLLFLSGAETFLGQGQFEPEAMVGFWQKELEKSSAEGFRGLRITGEMTWALQPAPGVDRLIEYEFQMNEFSQAENFFCLCQYDRRRFEPTLLREVWAAHETAVIGTEILDNIYYLSTQGLADPEHAAARFEGWLNSLTQRQRAQDAREQELRQVNEHLRHEIDERRQMADRLRESEARFLAFMHHLPGGAVIRDLEGRYLFANDEWEKAFSREKGDWQGKTLEDIWPPELAGHLRKLDQQVIADRHPAETVITFALEEGSRSWLMNRFPILDEAGRPVMVGATGIDITARCAAEEALYREKEKYQTLAEKSPLGISIISKDGRYRYLNPKFVEIFGYTLEDIPTGREWFARAYPDSSYRRQVMTAWINDLKYCPSGELEPRTFKVTCKDGSQKIINFSPVSLEGGDQIIIYEDITERLQAEEAIRESERRFRQLVEHAADALVLHDQGEIIEVNQQACYSLGYSRDELLNMSILDIEVGLDPQRLRNSWQQKLKTPLTLRGRHRRKDGSTFPVEVKVGDFDYEGRHLRLALARDITDRMKVEEALRQSETKFRTLVEQIPAITYTTALDTYSTNLYVSPQVETITGFSPADFEADPQLWKNQLHPHDRERVLAEIDKCRAAVKPFASEYRFLTRDGRVIWLNDEAWVVRDSDGQALFLQGVVLDITKRKELEKALQKSEEEYRLLVNQIPAVVFRGYPDWSISCFDRKIEDLTGHAKEDFDTRRVKWSDLIPGEEMDYVKQAFLEGLKTTKSYVREHRIRKKNGDYAWVQCRGQIFCDPEGKVDYVSGVTFDITKHKQAEAALRDSEKRYRLLAENVTDVIWTTDLNLRVTYISPSVKLLRGFTPEEVLGQRLEEILAPASLQLAWETLAEALALEERSFDPSRYWDLELEQYRKDGSTVWTEVRASLLRDESGRPVGTLGITRDISKRKEAEKSLRDSEENLRSLTNQLLVAQEKERKRLAAELHDELGHSLLTLKLRLNSLEKQLAPQQKTLQRNLKQILRDVGLTLENVRRLYLDLSPGDLEDLGLTGALRSMIEDFTELNPKIICSVTIDNLDNLFPAAMQTAIYRIVQEALTNIGKHAKAKHISVAAARQKHKISFQIADDGKGFDRDKVLASKKSLGLLTMEERVKILGGSFELSSQKKQGTRISFTIPVPEERN